MASTSKRTGEMALCALLAACAIGVYADFFSGSAFALPVLVAAVVPAAVVWSAPGRWRPATIAVVLVTALVVVGAGAAYLAPVDGATSVPGAVAAFGRGLVDGWAAMLAAALPADASPDLLATPVALTFLAAAAAALLAVHTSGPVTPVGPPALALAAAVALSGEAGGRRLPLLGAFLVTALALMLVRANRVVDGILDAARAGSVAPELGGDDVSATRSPNVTRSPTPAGRVAFGVPLVVGIAVASPMIAAALPPGRDDRFDPRDLRHERLEIGDVLSPLVAVKAQLKSTPPQELFRVELEIDGGPAPDRMRVAALDAYDGALWTATGDYLRAGHDLPGDPAGGPGDDAPGGAGGRDRAPVAEVRQTVTLLGLDGPFLPAAGRAVAVDAGEDAAATGFDAASGNLVTTRTDRRGTSYVVISEVVMPDDVALAEAVPSTGPELDALRVPPPGMPPELAQAAQQWTAGASTRVEELLALRDVLREVRYDDSLDAEPGHSYEALRRVLIGDESEREGYAEQFAAAYAVLARSRGFATRVAVGYLLPAADADGSVTVTEADIHAWPEVHLDGYGWVAIEPTGERVPATREPDDVQAAPGERRQPPADVERPRPPAPPASIPATVDDAGDRGGSGLPLSPAQGGGIGAAVLAVVLLVPAAAKRWRRGRRRHAATASGRVVGAWRETVDRLRELGLPVAASRTPDEVAADVAERFPSGAAAVAEMVPLVGTAVYADFEPDGAAADRAWRLAGDARGGVGRDAGAARRVRAAVDPRPLVTRRGRRASAGGRDPVAAAVARSAAAARDAGGDDLDAAGDTVVVHAGQAPARTPVEVA